MDKYIKVYNCINSSFTNYHFEVCEKMISQIDNDYVKQDLAQKLKERIEEIQLDEVIV